MVNLGAKLKGALIFGEEDFVTKRLEGLDQLKRDKKIVLL
jgi:hypothetical protein